MARIRTIKPEFWASEALGRLSNLARLTYLGLINLADDDGRGRADESWLWGQLHSYQGPNVRRRFHGALLELRREDSDGIPWVAFYEIGGCKYYWIPTFSTHQRIDRPKPSKLPAHPDSTIILRKVVERLSQEQGSGIRDQGSGSDAGRPGDASLPGPPATGGRGTRKGRKATPEIRCLTCQDQGTYELNGKLHKCPDCPSEKG